jgi:hypothetical protein
MLRADPSAGSCFSEYKHGLGTIKAPRRERPHQQACDRCKGQKLRCIRSPNLRAPCERCQKAGATCTVDLSVRMGRPKRTDKDQRGSTASSNPPQPTRPPALPSTSHTASGGFTSNGDTWSGYNLDDTPDPTLQGVQYLEFFDIDIALQDTIPEDKSLDMPPEHYLDPSLDLSLAQSIPTLTPLTNEGTAVDTATVNAYNRFPPMRQESTQKLSNLNLELYRQLGVLGSMASNDANIHPGLATPPGGTHTSLSDAVVFMMHGLQTYDRLLVEILGFTGPTHDAMYCSHDQPKSSTTSDGMDMDSEDPRGPVSEAASRQRRLASQSDGNCELTVVHDPSPSHGASALLDTSTSLLLLSCYANLFLLCRDAFAAIRAALLAKHRPITFFSISFLHTNEVSIPQDPDLQIIVLTQAVIRLIERIGRLLGYPDGCEDDSGCERCEPNLRSHNNVIPPELLDLVLRRAASGEGLLDRVGIGELREEIRGLYELVYRPV